jgi:hypothetical protein
MANILCLIGIHFWKYDATGRICKICQKFERAEYDMAYGETYYVKEK